MSADKYPSIFSRQMATIVYILDEVSVISRIIKVPATFACNVLLNVFEIEGWV